MFKLMTAALAGLCLLLPLAAKAQNVPSYATQPYTADENIHGRVTGFDGAYSLSVRDERGFIDNVRLHPGTVINPTGLTLAPGMVVSVLGYNAGSYFSANEIDTPYHLYGPVPYYAGHPWNYYGPSVALSFYFGNAGWWHGSYLGGGYRYVGGVRVFNRAHAFGVYRHPAGISYHRAAVVPHGHVGNYGHAHGSPGLYAHAHAEHHPN